MVDPATARNNMVESQIRTNRVTDRRLIEAMQEIPRERFVPKSMQSLAYLDEDLPIGDDRYLVEPMVLARLLQSAELDQSDMALDIGCGAGYSAAVLARLCDTVVAVEADARLAKNASETLAELNIDNAAVVEGPLDQGCPKQGPYDVVLFNGAIASVPPAIEKQVADGGRIVAVVIGETGVGRGTVFVKSAGGLTGRTVFDAAIPVLPGFERASGFDF